MPHFQYKPKPSKSKSHPSTTLKPVNFYSPSYKLEHAREYPILGCWIMQDWQEHGITPVVVVRQMDENRGIYGVFLVDIFCQGVKDALWKIDISLKQIERDMPRLCSGNPLSCETSLAHEIIYGAVQYARKYGFEPHLDFTKASLILDPPETYPPSHQVNFGKDGKPFFVAGPYDNSQAIYNKLMHTAGEGNFNYLLMIDGPED